MTGVKALGLAADPEQGNVVTILNRGTDVARAKGANVNARNNKGETPLQLASNLGFTEGVEALLKLGAKVDDGDDATDDQRVPASHPAHDQRGDDERRREGREHDVDHGDDGGEQGVPREGDRRPRGVARDLSPDRR